MYNVQTAENSPGGKNGYNDGRGIVCDYNRKFPAMEVSIVQERSIYMY